MYNDTSQFKFPTGVVVFFRALTPDNSMARSIHPTARNIVLNHDEDYEVVDADGRILGWYPRDFVSAGLPLEIVPEQPKEINVRNAN